MQIQTEEQQRQTAELDVKLQLALTVRPTVHRVWCMLALHGEPHRAEPLLVVVKITAEDGELRWHPISGRTIGADAREIDVETLRGPRIWWGPWLRRFASSRVRVELRQQLRQEKPVEHGLGVEVDRVLAGLEERERDILRERFGLGGADGDRQLRVIAEFPPARGCGETCPS